MFVISFTIILIVSILIFQILIVKCAIFVGKQSWLKTQDHVLQSKKPFGVNIATLKKSPDEQPEMFLKFAFQIDSIILNLFTGMGRFFSKKTN